MSDTINKRMPNLPQEQELLRKRAIYLASTSKLQEQQDRDMFLHIYLGKNEHYGIDYVYLDKILRPRLITPMPDSNAIIAGVIPYQGELITVLDLCKMLDIAQTTEPQTDKQRYKNSWLVIITIKQIHLALLVNDIRGNYHYQKEQLSSSINNTVEFSTGFVHGIYADKIAILDLHTILNSHQLKLE
ncbi:MAG: chemotaxis protein CheW [Pseudomonadota bacterium]